MTSAENRVDRSPWIRVGNHKKGMPSKNVVIANNIANRIVNTSDPFYKIVVEGNYEVTSYLNDFADAAGLDYRLKAASPAVDGGTVSWAATVDMENSARPMGKGPDAGAYEVR